MQASSVCTPSAMHFRRFFVYCICLFNLLYVTSGVQLYGKRGVYARFPKWNACVNSSFSFQFKTQQKSALLMYTDDSGSFDFFEVGLVNGTVRVRVNIVDGREGSLVMELGNDLNDNQWHTVDIKRNRFQTTAILDNSPILRKTQTSYGSDFQFGNLETNSDVYFGGMPQSYMQNLVTLALPSVMFELPALRGEIRNVLYGNCSCDIVRGKVMPDESQNFGSPEICDVRDPCGKCLCISTDTRAECRCLKDTCTGDSTSEFYHLPMDAMDGQSLVNPSGLDSTAYGNPSFVKGALGKALEIDGKTQYAVVSGPGHRYECFGDLSLCDKGYTVGFWIKFEDAGDTPAVYLSNGGHNPESHGIAMKYRKGWLQFVFKRKDGNLWKVEGNNVLSDKWYHVSVTWKESEGLALYINGDNVAWVNKPERRAPVNVPVSNNNFVIGRSNDDTGLNDLSPIIVDEFKFWSEFKTEEQIRELGPMYKYHLDMEQILGGELITPVAHTEVTGNVKVVKGMVNNGVEFTGDGAFIDLGDFRDSCLGDVSKCIYGFYVSFWIKIFAFGDNVYYFSSGRKGFEIYSSGRSLYAVVWEGDRKWEESFYGIRKGQWMFVEVSWSRDVGLLIFQNQKIKAMLRESVEEKSPERELSNFIIGRGGVVRESQVYPRAIVDEVEMFYGERRELLYLDFIQRGKPTKYHFGLDSIVDNLLPDTSMRIEAYRQPRVVPGKVGNAIKLNGERQYIDFGDHVQDCLGNLDNCHHGVLASLWFKPSNYKNDMVFFSNGANGITLQNNGNDLKIEAHTTTRKWNLSTDNLNPNEWHFLEISWDPDTGLKLLVDNRLKRENSKPEIRPKTLPSSGATSSIKNKFYLGRGNKDMDNSEYGEATYDELEYWYGPRSYLISHGYLQRGKPNHFLINMEEKRNGNLVHPKLNLRLNGDPSLVPAVVGNALELNRANQYLDIGQHPGTCLGNLEKCNNGITIAAWMNFERFLNNMYIMSTGNNGLRMYYKNGYIYASIDQNGKQWKVQIPKVEENTWNHMELSWHPDFGLSMYINNTLAAHSGYENVESEVKEHSPNFFVGRANQADSLDLTTNAEMKIDEMEIWYGRREDLIAFNYLLRDNIKHETFAMEYETNGRIRHPRYDVTLRGRANLVPGKIGNAVELNRRGQFVDLGISNDKCFANLNNCKKPITISLWTKANRLPDGLYFLSSPTYSLYHSDGNLIATITAGNKTWTTSTPIFRINEWHNIDVSWSAKKGLSLYLDGSLKNVTKRSSSTTQRSIPEGVFIGKTTDRSVQQASPDILVDELQYWLAPRERVVSAGHLSGFIKKEKLPFDTRISRVNNTQFFLLPMRNVHLYGEPRQVMGQDGVEIKLNGREQYMYIGDDVICSGNFDHCPNGFTVGIEMTPDRLSQNVYYVDSYPLSVFYQDNRLNAIVRSRDKSWKVAAPGLSRGKKSKVQVSWQDQEGLKMYIDGTEVASQAVGTPIGDISDANRKLYVGSSVSDSGNIYAQGTFKLMEVWNARRSYVNAYAPEGPVTPPPPLTPIPRQPPTSTRFPGTVGIYYISSRMEDMRRNTDQSSSTVFYGRIQEKSTGTIRYQNNEFTRYNIRNLVRLYPQLVRLARKETFSLQFITKELNGLIWADTRTDLIMYLKLDNGNLVFVYDDRQAIPRETTIYPSTGTVLTNFEWHSFEMTRVGKKIDFYLDGRYTTTTLPRDIQFVQNNAIFLGGVPDIRSVTRGRVSSGYKGGISEPSYFKIHNNNLATKINLVETRDTLPVPTPLPFRPTTAPVTTVTTVSTKVATTSKPRDTSLLFERVSFLGSIVHIQGYLDLRQGGSVLVQFQTLDSRGLIFLAIKRWNSQDYFIAMEIFDGKLYLVFQLSSAIRRTLLSDYLLNDGNWHNIKITFTPSSIVAYTDENPVSMRFSSEEKRNAYFDSGIYFAGVGHNVDLPWQLWSYKDPFIGCLRNAYLYRVRNNFYTLRRLAPGSQRIQFGCKGFEKSCDANPCQNGVCQYNEYVNGFRCYCDDTGYMGARCQLVSYIAGFNGQDYTVYYYETTQVTHINDISIRFRTPLEDTFLFQTIADGYDQYIRGELQDGRLKVTIKSGPGRNQIQTFDVRSSSKLADDEWHTFNFKRRAQDLEMWVDKDTHAKEQINDRGFYLHIDRIYLGFVDPNLWISDVQPAFIGGLQNVYFNYLDILNELYRQPQAGIVWIQRETDYPDNLNFNPVTFTSRESYSNLKTLPVGDALHVTFKLKTSERNGVVLFNKGPGNEFIAVELVNGYMQLQLNNGRNTFVRQITRTVSDDAWHVFELQELRIGGNVQYEMRVDAEKEMISSIGTDRLDLTGPLYVGGLPSNMFKTDNFIQRNLNSTHGYIGCLASVKIGGVIPDLQKYGSNDDHVKQGCIPIGGVCPAVNPCQHNGICVTGIVSFTCNCNMTAYAGSRCHIYPLGMYFGKNNRPGALRYTFKDQLQSSGEAIALGFMTYADKGVLAKFESETGAEYVELRLDDGYVVAEYDTGNGIKTVRMVEKRFNDGKRYHTIVFSRNKQGSKLIVDGSEKSINHAVTHSIFNELKYVDIGGRLGSGTNVSNSFNGIVGGLFWNGYRFIDLAHGTDVQMTQLGDITPVTPDRYVLVTPSTPVENPKSPSLPLPDRDVIIPGDYGGMGIIEKGGIDVGDSDVIVSGAGGFIPAGVLPKTAAQTAGGAGAGGTGPFVPVRAGALMGTILGTLAFFASLLWAFWQCKPGMINPCGGGGGGGGPEAAPLTISSPTGTTNLAVTQALGGPGAIVGGGTAGGGIAMNSIAAKPAVQINGGSVVNGGATLATYNASSAAAPYNSSVGLVGGYSSTSAVPYSSSVGNGGGATLGTYHSSSAAYNSNSGGNFENEAETSFISNDVFDSATLRATGTFSNKGTIIGEQLADQEYLTVPRNVIVGSSSSYAYSQRSGNLYNANGHTGVTSMDGVGYGESTTADYDLVHGMPPENYLAYTATLNNDSGFGGGTLNKGHSTSTMASGYNYQVQNVRTMMTSSTGHHIMGYGYSASGDVTPGAAGDEVRVDCCLMTSDGRQVVTGSSLGPPQVWDMSTGELLRIMKGNTVGSANLYLACSDRLLVGAVHADQAINGYSTSSRKGVTMKMLQIWDFTTGKPLEMGSEETCSALCVMSDPDKVVFARSDVNGKSTDVIIWDLLGNQPIKEMQYNAPVGNKDYVNFLALSQNDRYCVAGYTNSKDNFVDFVIFDVTLTSYNISDPSLLRFDANSDCTVILPNDEAVTGLRNGELVIWSLRNGGISRKLSMETNASAHKKEIKALALSSDNKYLVSASADGTLKVWDMKTETKRNTLSGHSDEVWCVTISHDNEMVFSGSRDGSIILWKLKGGTEVCAFSTGVDVFYVTMSHDKGTIVALGDKFGARKLIMLQVVRSKIRREISS